MALLVSGLGVFAGCGDSGPKMAPVEGTVSLDGKPLNNIMVEFWPSSAGPRSIAVSDAQGRYKLMADDGKREGAAVGPHKVVLHDVSVYGENPPVGRAAENVDVTKGKKPRISNKFASPETTTISQTVEDKKNDLNIDIPK